MAGRKPTVRTQEWVDSVIDAYRRGQSIIFIAGCMGVSEKTVSRVLRDNSITLR